MKNAISTAKISREDWLKLRMKGIGSSDVAGVLGLNRWKSPHDVYQRKIGEVQEDDDNFAMLYGRMMEETIAKIFALQTGMKVKRDLKIRLHPDHPFMIANLDRLCYDAEKKQWGILEIKTAGDWAAQNWDEDIPIPYFCQVQHQLYVTGLTWGYIGLQISNRELRKIFFQRDDKFIEEQNKILFKFWEENVQGRVPPAWTAIDIYKIQADPESILEVPEEKTELAQKLVEAKQHLEIAKNEFDAVSTEVKLLMDKHEVLTVKGDAIATWKQAKGSSKLNSERLSADHPDIVKQYMEDTPGSRKFLVKLPKQKKGAKDE